MNSFARLFWGDLHNHNEIGCGKGSLERTYGLAQLTRDSGLPQLAHAAMIQTRLLVNNPCPLTEADALAIYRSTR
jgi:hypothetical protein